MAAPRHLNMRRTPDRHAFGVLLLLGLLAVFALGLALMLGSVPVTAGDVLAVFAGRADGMAGRLVLELRLPRALSAFATGALLAVAGSLMQVLVRNPLADPYVLGISGGAAVAALLALLAGLGGLWLTGSAFGGALLAMLLVFGLAHRNGDWSPTRLLLTGVVLASGWGALVSFLLVVSPDSRLHGMLFWLMGDLAYAGDPGPALAILGLGLLACWPLARDLNVLQRGDLQAGALGVDTRKLQRRLYLLASLLTASAVVQAGSIGFVGLVIPHLVRLLGLTDHRLLLPGAALAGGGLLVLADTLARTLLAPQQLPVGIITALIGIPLFLHLLQRGARTP
ncbi:MAG TPA: iron ABC transporter permease [Gammaproteobacteria bacterium]|nr:iron ABC transporter permease [Gammaproteobacteria bacterium]